VTQAPPRDDVEVSDPEPRDELAEQIVIGAALLDANVIRTCTEMGLRPAAFYRPAHQTLWATASKLAGEGNLEPGIMAAQLQRDGDTNRVGGAVYLHTCIQAVPTTANAGWYARRILDMAAQRRVYQLGRRLAQIAGRPATDSEDLFDKLVASLGEVTDAISEIEPTRPAGKHPDLDLENLFTNPPEPVELLAGGVLALGRITVIYAPAKTSKSLLVQFLSARLAQGAPALETTPSRPLNIVYIDQEMTEQDWHERLRDMGFGVEEMRKLRAHLHVKNLQDWPALDTPEGGRELAAVAAGHNADIVVIDTLSKVCAGPENENDTFQAFYRNTLLPLKREGRGAVVLDHPGKDVSRGPRGGSAKTDNVDLVWELARRGESIFSLKRTHSRFRHPSELLYLNLQEEPLAFTTQSVDSRAEDLVDRCLEMIRGFDPARSATGRDVMKDVKDTGFHVRATTFYEAWKRFRYEKGWSSD
jgi:hypothetical protein